MSKVYARKACFFIPLRFGIIAFTVIGLVGGALAAAFSFLLLLWHWRTPLQTPEQMSLLASSVMYTILVVITLLGLVAVILRRRNLIKIYCTSLALHLGLHIAFGTYALYTLFRNNGKSLISICSAGNLEKMCRDGFAPITSLTILVFVLTGVLELYLCILLSSYSQRLKEGALSLSRPSSQASSSSSFSTGSSDSTSSSKISKYNISNPQPLTMYNSVGAPGLNNGYVFSTVEHSYGVEDMRTWNTRPISGAYAV